MKYHPPTGKKKSAKTGSRVIPTQLASTSGNLKEGEIRIRAASYRRRVRNKGVKNLQMFRVKRYRGGESSRKGKPIRVMLFVEQQSLFRAIWGRRRRPELA